MTTINATLEARWNTALADSAAAGVPVLINDAAPCCRSCHIENDPREVFTLSQFGIIKFRRDAAVYAEEVEAECYCTDDEYNYEGTRVIREGETCGVCSGRDEPTEEITVKIASVWFYYNDIDAARTFCSALDANGIPFHWSGSKDDAIEVLLNG